MGPLNTSAILALAILLILGGCQDDVSFGSKSQLPPTATAVPTITPVGILTVVQTATPTTVVAPIAATTVAANATISSITGQAFGPPVLLPALPTIPPLTPVSPLSSPFVPLRNGKTASNHGVSALGLCSPAFDCGRFLRIFDDAPMILTGWLDNTFGGDCNCAARLLADPRPKIVRIHIANGPCLRNQRCRPYEIFAGESVQSADRKVKMGDPALMGRFMERWSAVQALTEKAISTRLLISNCLECDLSPGARKKLLRLARRFFPAAEFVDNPGPHGGRCIPGLLCEHHSQHASGKGSYLVDLDGVDYYAVDPVQYSAAHSGALMTLIWRPSFNGLAGEQVGSDPRTRRGFPTEDDFRAAREWVLRIP